MVRQRRKLVNFGFLVVLVAAGLYFVGHYWTRAADALPAAALLSATAPAGRTAAIKSRAVTPRSSTHATSSSATAGALAAAKLQEQSAESRELAQLRAVAQDPTANATVRAQAAEEVLQLQQMQAQESLAEVVLAAKGYANAVVILRPASATVLVPAGPFDAQKAAQVAQTVANVAGLDPAEIQIVPTA